MKSTVVFRGTIDQKCHYCSKNLDFTIWSLCLESAYVAFVKYSSKVNMSCIKMTLGNHHA